MSIKFNSLGILEFINYFYEWLRLFLKGFGIINEKDKIIWLLNSPGFDPPPHSGVLFVWNVPVFPHAYKGSLRGNPAPHYNPKSWIWPPKHTTYYSIFWASLHILMWLFKNMLTGSINEPLTCEIENSQSVYKSRVCSEKRIKTQHCRCTN